MRKKGFVLGVCLLLLLLLPGLNKAEEEKAASKKINFAVKLSAGMNYLALGDINAHLKGFSDFFKDQARLEDKTAEGEFKKIHLELDFEGDVIVYLTPQFGISLGSGYIYGKKGKDVNKIISVGKTFSVEVKVSAIPVRLGAYYSLPISSKAQFFLNGGVGYYFAKWSEDWPELSLSKEANASGIGFYGGLGFEFNLASNIAFVIEAKGRYAKIGGFEGTSKDTFFQYTKEGKLYYFEWFPWTYKWYPMIDISKEEPSGDRIRNIREAKVDFSGFTLRAGIKINF